MIERITPSNTLSEITPISDRRIATSSMSTLNTQRTNIENTNQKDLRVEQTVTATNNTEKLQDVVEQMNERFQRSGANINLSINRDKETGKNIVKLIDNETKEVIRQIPSEDFLKVTQAIDKFLERSKGVIINEKA